MKNRPTPYIPPHMVARMEKVREIWIAEHEKQKKQHDNISGLFSYVIGYSAGYMTPSHTWYMWLIGVSVSVFTFGIMNYIFKVYKINI